MTDNAASRILVACISAAATFAVVSVAGVVRDAPRDAATLAAEIKITNARVGRIEGDVREILQHLKPETRYQHGNEEDDEAGDRR